MRVFRTFLCLSLVLGMSSLATATTVWTGAVDSDYFNAGNWDDGVPVGGAGTKFVGSEAVLTGGSGQTWWFEVTGGGTFRIGNGGSFNGVAGSNGDAQIAEGGGTNGTLILEGDAQLSTAGIRAGTNGTAQISMSGTSSWESRSFFNLGRSHDDFNLGEAHMVMSDNATLTVFPGQEFTIKGNKGIWSFPSVAKSSLTMQDNAQVILQDEAGKPALLTRFQSYIDDGLLINAQVADVGDDVVISAIPEPSTMLLLALGSLTALIRRRC